MENKVKINGEIISEHLKTPIAGEYDVVVCGGGVAGVASALASSRAGAKILLIEKSFMLGGLATAGLVTIYLPICDGKGKQVCFSIAEELLKLSIKYGEEFSRVQGIDIGAWTCDNPTEEILERRKNSRYQVQFNHNVFAILCERLLLDEGVKILYGTSLCSTVSKDNILNAIVCENKNGRIGIKAKSFIDATGDADLCYYAGEKTEVYERGNVLASWYYEHLKDELFLNMLGYCEDPFSPVSETKNADNRYIGVDSEEITSFMTNGRASILRSFLRGGNITKDRSIATISTQPQLRMTRKLVGLYEIDESEDGKEFYDSVGLFPNWKKSGPIYEMPLRALRGEKFENLFACGRCLSVSQTTWDVTRVIPVCAVSGEAVGIASALYSKEGKVDLSKLQERLKANGVKLHPSEL